MYYVTLLMQCLWAAEQAEKERIQKAEDDRLFEDIMQNRDAIRIALDNGVFNVYLPRPMPARKRMYNLNEFREFLDQEKTSRTKSHDGTNYTDAYNDVVAKRCGVCYDPLFVEKTEESLFKKRVFRAHKQPPTVMMCPNPRCSSGRICCTCIQTLIKDGTRPVLFRTPIKYFDINNVEISDERMVICPFCRNYLNFELSEVEQVPENANMSKREKLNRIEDLVNSQDKTYWLLEEARSFTDNSHQSRFLRNIYDLVFPKSSQDFPDNDQMLLVLDLSTQYNFFSGCTGCYEDFGYRVNLIRGFIKKCTEKLTYTFITKEFRNSIISSNLSHDQLEEQFKDICSAVPIEQADNFSTIYYAMITGYFEKTKDYNKNRQFITRWILSKYSFILTGFQHKRDISDNEASYYPPASVYYNAFSNALHDPRLIDNIIKYNALEFTFRGLSHYPRDNTPAYESFISFLTKQYYKQLKEENSFEVYRGNFVNRHGADARRFSYPVYKKLLTRPPGQIVSTDFNLSNGDEILIILPAFIYNAILKVLYTAAPAHFDGINEKITEISILYSTLYKCDKNYADYLHEAYKTKSCAETVGTSIAECIRKKDFQNAIFLFKNLPCASATSQAIELFRKKEILPKLIREVKTFEFVSWENETPIYTTLKQHCRGAIPQLLAAMRKQPSCFFEVPNEEIDYVIRKYQGNYGRIGSLAFVCRNKELLESFKDNIDGILSNWGFAQDLDKFYSGVFSPEGTASISDLPFFRMYYAELFTWLDNNISDDALKISRMLMVAKLAARGLAVKMEVDERSSTIPGQASHKPNNAPNFTLEKNMLRAVGRTKVGYFAFCAFQVYLGASFKKHLEKDVLPEIVAIEGAENVELLGEWRLRGHYRQLFKLQESLNTEQGMASCSEEEMRKFLEMLSVLKQIESFGALKNIKDKREIQDICTHIKYYTDNITVLPERVCEIVIRSLDTCGQKIDFSDTLTLVMDELHI
ncbi:hypothetical protein ENBRE01_1325 [Enteropsectra breve]|nr:hypothetical protein ENBRE01_1325 [Enteropsectra breve]